MSLDTNTETGRKSSSFPGNGTFVRLVGRIAFALFTFALITGIAASAAFAQSVIYNAVPGTLAPNYPSQAYQAQQTAEFGDYVHLGGTARVLKTVTVTMSNWATEANNTAFCASHPALSCTAGGYDYPFTLNIYNIGTGAVGVRQVGSLIATITQTKTVPWRPADDLVNCPADNAWFSGGTCYHGYAFNMTFDMSSLNALLPNDVVVGLAFNTQTWGAVPTGEAGPYTSLNMALPNSPAAVGTDDNSDSVFWNTATATRYTDLGVAGVGVFREDTIWTPYGTIPIQITAIPNTLVVDDDGTGSAGNCDDATPAYSTIGAAVTAAAVGDIVKVCPGTYNESPQIDKSLSLQSTGGRDVTTIQLLPNGSPGTGYLAGVYINSPTADVVIDGFTITGNDAANPALANSNVVSQASNSLTVTNSRLKVGAIDGGSNGDDGIGILTTYASGAGPVSVTNNEFVPVNTSGARAFYINPATGNTFSFQNNQITGNFVYNAATECGGPISNNTVTGTGASGGFGASNFGGPPCGDPGPFTNNSVTGAATGIRIRGANNTVLTGNSFTGNGIGIWFDTDTVTGTVAHFNRIANNSSAGIQNDTASVANAENNWWGCNYGPAASGPGCPVATNGVTGAGAASVDANPWLVMTQVPLAASTTVGVPIDVYTNLWKNSDGGTPSGGFVRNGTPSLWATDFGSLTPQLVTTIGQTGTFISSLTPGVANVSTTIDGQTVSRSVGIYNALCVGVSIPTNITTLKNVPVTVPINVDLTTGRNILGFVTTINYDSTKLTFNGIDKTGTLSSGFAYEVSNSTADPVGTLQIFGSDAFPLSGSGVLLNLSFTTTGAISATPTPVTFASFSFNEGNPTSCLTNGSVKIISGDITGVVKYALTPVNPVPLVTMSAAGSVNVSTSTAAITGAYTLTGLGSGTYVVTPSKTAQPLATVNGITPSDASCIAEWGVGQICTTGSLPIPTAGTPRFRAADVTKNGTLSPLDAAYIAQFSVGIANPSFTGTWEFIAPNTSYTALQVETGMPNQDYTAILLGDVTGNWSPTLLGGTIAPPSDGLLAKDAILAAAPDMEAVPGSSVSVPIKIQDLTRHGVTAYQFDLAYDPQVLEPLDTAADLAGTVSEGMSIVSNPAEPGRLRVAVYGVSSLQGEGALVNLHFRAIGAVGSVSPLFLRSLVLNEGGIAVMTRDGQVRVAESAQGTIRGRLLTSGGQGVANSRVTITSTTGETRSVVSSSFGNFEFGGLVTGETYTVTVSSRRYTFTPRTVSIADAVTALDMISEQ